MEEESGFFGKEKIDSHLLTGSDELHDFRLVHEAEKGFLRVFEARRNGKRFIVKTLKEEYRNQPAAQAALRKEYEAAFRIESKYVVRYLDFLSLPDFGMAILMDFCSGRNIVDMLGQQNFKLSDEDASAIVEGLFKGLEDIHLCGIAHRDIKPSNLIYDPSTKKLTIIDFSCADGENFYIFKGASGTKGFAPQRFEQPDYKTSTADDFYSAGMTLAVISELFGGRVAARLRRLGRLLIEGKRLTPEKAVDIIKGRKSRAWKWSLSVIGALLIIGVVFFGVLKGGGVDKIGDERESVAKNDESDDLINETNIVAENKQDKEIKETHVNTVTNGPIDEKEKTDNPEVAESELFPEAYGVKFDEARYLKNFRSNQFDHYVILRTETFLQECCLTINSPNKTESEKAEALERFNDFDALWETVSVEVENKFPEADMRRAKGLALQRWRFWTITGYRTPGFEF